MTGPLGRCGRYELLRFIDSGGMGEIFLARGPSPAGERSLVALKRLIPQVAEDRSFVGMFMDEAHLAMRLAHDNICRVHQMGRDGDQYFLVMEHVDGVSLRDAVRRVPKAGPIPWPIVARVVADTAGALHYAHELTDEAGRPYHVVHRDVSPPNIMIGFDGRTRLLDFGLAKARTQLEKTKPGLVKGKFSYLAPEQLKGHIAPSVDIFALGLCTWEALTGRQLNAMSAAKTVADIQAFRGPRPVRRERDDVPEAFDAILARMLDPDPATRFRTAAEVEAVLEELLRGHREPTDEARVAAWVRSAFPDREPPPARVSDAPVVDAASSVADLVDQASRPPPAAASSTRTLLLAAAVALVVAAVVLAIAL